MRKEQKNEVIQQLKQSLEESNSFYLADSSELTVAEVNDLRRLCFEKGVSLQVVKNTLIKKALEQVDGGKYEPLYDVLSGPTSLMISEEASLPAKIIKEFRKKNEKPVLKAAYIDSDFYIGDGELEGLSTMKSKEELLGEIIGLLQSPVKNVISGLKSSSGKLAGIVKTLSERPE